MGEWHDDKFNGKGEYIYKKGDKFIGYFVNDKKKGHGL